MTATPHDFIRLEGPAASVDLNCIEYGIEWPPPAQITHIGGEPLDLPFNLVTHSDLTDEQATNDPTVHRGALYWPINYEGTNE